MVWRAVIVLVLLALAAPAAATAATRYAAVGGSATDPACPATTPCTLVHALDVAVDGDEVVVAPGDYVYGSPIYISRRLDVHGAPGGPRPRIVSTAAVALGVSGNGARVADLEVQDTAPPTPDATTIFLTASDVLLERVVARQLSPGESVITMTGVSAVIRDTVAIGSAADNRAINVIPYPGNVTLELRNVTALALGGGPSRGLSVYCYGGLKAVVHARNLLARGTQADISITGEDINSRPTFVVSSSDYRAITSGNAAIIEDPDNIHGDPALWSSDGWHEHAASVTRDAGTTDGLVGALDVDGQPRVAGSAPDIGADEFPAYPAPPAQPLAGDLLTDGGAEAAAPAKDATGHPPVPGWETTGALTAVAYGAPGPFPAVAEATRIFGGAAFFAGGPAVGTQTARQVVDLAAQAAAIDAGRASATLRASLGGAGEAPDRAAVRATFRGGDGAPLGVLDLPAVTAEDRGGETVLLPRSAAGPVPAGARTAEVVLTATPANGSDAYGNGYADDIGLALTVAAAPPPPAAADTEAPVISALRATHRTFAPLPLRARAGRAARGTAFAYRLSEAAKVRITIARRETGRRSGGRCVKPTRRLRRAKRCTRYVLAGRLPGAGAAGANRTPFSGRFGRRALKPGRYRATLVATDAAGNRSAPRAIALRVVRR